MKTVLRFTALLLLWLAFAPQDARAQAEGTAFTCDGTFYQIRQVNTTSSLFKVNRSAAAYTTTPVNIINGTSNNLGVLLNGLAYNPRDGYLYALSTTGTSTTLPTSVQMYKIGQGGIQLLGTVTGMPNIQVASGTIDKNGNYYVSSQNSTGTANYFIYKYDLNQTGAARLAASALRLRNAANSADVNLTFYDLALNPADNLLYGVFQNGTLWRIDQTSFAGAGQAAVTVVKATATNTDPVGTAFFDVSGNLFVYTNGVTTTANSGGFYQVNLLNGAYTLISNIDPASVSDGASCINPDQRIDIVKEVTSVVRTTSTAGLAGREFDVTFTLKVKNTSTATDNNVQVNDFLWSGSGTTVRANTTFSSTTGKLAQTVALVGTPTVTAAPGNVNPVFNLAINPAYTGIGGAPGTVTGALLTGNQPLTAGQAAIITFTTRVTYSATANIPARADNQGYASSSTVANATGFSQVAASGLALSPDQLLASDRSTDGPTLPVVANDDTPTPSPIFFSTTITGTVFEDINYGGGVGRSQTASNGIGAEGVRVELYSAAGAFLTFTTTDAAGTYAFSTTNGTTALANNTTYQVRVVNSTVVSNRLGTPAGLLGVQTFNNGVTNLVGGASPYAFDAPANAGTATGTGGQTLTALTTAAPGSAIETITSVLTPLATGNPAVLGVDFGFNFDLVVNTNATGQGSLRQFIKNSNALTNENLAQTSSVAGVTLTPGKEYAIFMMSDGTTITNGLRAGITPTPYSAAGGGYLSTTGFTIAPTAAFDAISDDDTVIDGALQAALTGNKVPAVAGTTTGAEVTLNFAANRTAGLFVTGANTRIASLTLTGALGSSVNSTNNPPAAVAADGAAVTFSGANAAGSVVTDVTATANYTAGVRLQAGATDVTVSNNILRAGVSNAAGFNFINSDASGIVLADATANTISGNTISGNAGYGIVLSTGTNEGNTISGNTITGNGTGTVTTSDAGIAILSGANNLIRANTITGNAGDGIMAMAGTAGNRFTQNNTGNNNGNGVVGNLGIDLSANATNTNGDGVTLNADGKTTASGANGLLNFPVFTQATINANTLFVSGYARTGALLEFFVASTDPTNFGEGATYLFSATEGGAGDTDTRFASYSGVIGNMGLNHGSETGVSRFVFALPVTAGQITSLVANRLTATASYPTTVNGLSVGNTSEFSGVITVTNNAPLPVELTSFTAQAAGADAQLTWATASEHNNDHFVVERALVAGEFVAIGTVPGAGSSAQAHRYSFTDAGIGATHAGPVYYRLRQVDTDGQSSTAPVRTLQFAAAMRTSPLAVYPNPATETTTLDLSALAAGSYQVTLVDLQGRTLRAGTYAGGAAYPVDLHGLAAGTYVVLVRGAGAKFNHTLVKK